MVYQAQIRVLRRLLELSFMSYYWNHLEYQKLDFDLVPQQQHCAIQGLIGA